MGKIFLLLILSLLLVSRCLRADSIDSLKSLLPGAGENQKTKLFKEIGTFYMKTDIDSCFHYLEMAEKLAKKQGNDHMLAPIIRAIGKAHAMIGDYEKAVHYTALSLKKYIQIRDELNVVLTYNNLGIFYSMGGDDDTAIYFHRKALKISRKMRDTVEIVEALNNIGTCFFYKNEYDSALFYLDKCSAILSSVDNDTTIGAVYNNYGLVYHTLGQMEKAIEAYLNSLKYFEKIGDTRVVNIINSNIGTLYIDLGYNDKAIDYFRVKAKSDLEYGNIIEYLKALNNIGICYSNLGYNDSSLYIYEKAVSMIDTIDNNELKGLLYKNLGDTYFILKRFNKALEYHKKSEACRIKENDLYALATTYNSLGDVYSSMGNYQMAINYLKKSEDIALQIGAHHVIAEALFSLADLYHTTGQFKLAAQYYDRYFMYNDTVMKESVKQQISDLETKYRTEQKEQQLKLQQVELLQKEEQIAREQAESEKKAAQRNIFIVGLVLMIFLAGVVFRSYRQKKKANEIINEKNRILEQANEEIAAQRDEIEAQRDEIEAQRDQVTEQRDLIMEQKKEITDSILYARRIQSAILPPSGLLEESFSDHFIMFRPRDIVSGDFYWFTKVEGQLVVAAADCTGHGVPGAFMSMLGTAFLNEIVNKEFITHPGVILRRLRKEIIRALQQQGDAGDSMGNMKDGMDIALCSFDFENRTCMFAGANNPIYLVRKSKGTEPEGTMFSGTAVSTDMQGTESPVTPVLTEVKGDKMPIAIYEKMDNFSVQEIQLESGDILYMFSDGFADQFGGPTGKKFKYKPFKELLIAHSELPLSRQMEKIEAEFDEWKDVLEQVDDVMVLGLKIR